MLLLLPLTLVLDLIVLTIRLILAALLLPALIFSTFTPGALNKLFQVWCRTLGIQIFKSTVHQRSSRPEDPEFQARIREDHVYAELAATRTDFERLRELARASNVYIGPARHRWFEPLGTTRLLVYYLRVSNWRNKHEPSNHQPGA